MADVVYLHVGPPKTGTTYLQGRLHLNRTELARHGVRYPTGLSVDMFGAALDLVERPWGGMRSDVQGEWDKLVRRVRRARGTAIVSHEVLAGATAEEAARAVRDLGAGGAELHVVYTARDIARQVGAEWQERLKHRRRVSFAKFVRRTRRPPRTRTATGFWQVQDLPDVHRRWAADLDPRPGAPGHGSTAGGVSRTALGQVLPCRRHRRRLGAAGRCAPQPLDRRRRKRVAAPSQHPPGAGRTVVERLPAAGPGHDRARRAGAPPADAAGDPAAGRP